MSQKTLDQFPPIEAEDYAYIVILKDIDVAGKKRDWHLHAQDVVFIEGWIADLLVERSAARYVSI